MPRDAVVIYPWAVVTIRCRYCARHDRYAIRSLLAEFGAEADWDLVLRSLSADCRLAEERTGKRGCNGAYVEQRAP